MGTGVGCGRSPGTHGDFRGFALCVCVIIVAVTIVIHSRKRARPSHWRAAPQSGGKYNHLLALRVWWVGVPGVVPRAYPY